MSVDAQPVTGVRERRGAGVFPNSIRELARGTLPLLLALGLLNASNYIFHVAVSRLLGPGDYGSLAALLAVVMVLSVPISVAQTVVAKRTAVLRAGGRTGEINAMCARTARALIGVGIAGLILLVLLGPVLAWFLRTEAAPAALLGPYWLLSIVLSVPLVVLQGRLRFGWLGGTALAGVAVRLGVGIGLVWAGAGVAGAMLGTVLGQGAALLLALLVVRVDSETWRRAGASISALRGEFRPALMALGSFWLLAEIDVMLARRYLEAGEAGLYAAAGLLARALLFLPAGVSIVALPRFAESSTPEEAYRRLRLALLAVGGLAVLAYPILVLLRGPVVSLAFGTNFAGAADLLPLLAAGMGFMAVISLLVFFHIAEGTRAYRLVLVAIAMEVALVTFFHRTGFDIGWIVLGVAATTAASMYHAGVAACRWRPQNLLPSQPGEPGLNGQATLDLSVVIPCHNAERGLGSVLETLCQELAPLDSWEVIVVSDGSTDHTVGVVEGFGNPNIHVIHEPIRIGKGHALRLGLSQARGRYVAFMDADGDIDPRAIRPALSLMELYEPDVVLGSKRHPLSEVQYPALRRLMSWTYHKLCRALFRVNVRDTQTGFKVIRRAVLAAVLPRMLEKRYAFDLEFLVVARKLGYRRVFEVPIKLDYRFESQVKPSAAYAIIQDTLAIFYRRYILGTYSPALPMGSTPISNRTLFSGNGGPRLRILFLNWRDIKNPEAGGAEVLTHEVARRWVRNGHEVHLFTSMFRGGSRSEMIEGVRIRRMGRLRTGTFHLRIQQQLARLRGFDAVIDEINTVPFFTPLWKRRLPTTVGLIHQLAADVWEAELPKPVAAIGRRLEPRVLRLYRGLPLITVSDSTRDDLLKLGLGQAHVIPNGCDVPPPLDGLEKEPTPTFLFVGRMSANKRPDHAISAFRHIRDRVANAQLWMVGRGPMEPSLRQNAPEGVLFLGHLPRNDFYRRLARAHCLLVPSVREGWGLVVTESAAVGTPAVGYDVPGLRDSIVHGATGFLVAAGQPTDLAETALALITSPTYESIRQAAKKRALNLTWDKTAERFEHILQELIDAQRRESKAEHQSPVLTVPFQDHQPGG